MRLSPAYRERLFAFINEAPFVKHMGMRITDIGWGSAAFELEAADYRLQPFGVIHGGNVATLIDSAAFWACFVAMGSNDDGLASVDLKLNGTSLGKKTSPDHIFTWTNVTWAAGANKVEAIAGTATDSVTWNR